MSEQPLHHELFTERLHLVTPTANHIAHYLDFFTDPAASSGYGGVLTPGATWSRAAHDRGIWAFRGFGVWLLELQDSGDVIGGCGFWQGWGWPRELTWWLLPGARGMGYAQEASRAAIDHAYDHGRWTTVQTYMEDDNASARALVSRLGGHDGGRHRFPDGKERTMYLLPHADGSHPLEPDVEPFDPTSP